MRLENKVALVTGGGTGIGRSISFLFASEGAKVVVIGRRGDLLKETVSEIAAKGGEAKSYSGDVSSSADARAMLQFALKQYGQVHVLVNNAGIVRRNEKIHELEEEGWDEHLAVNLKGVFLMGKYALPAMIAGGGGSIINMGSMLGLIAAPGYGSYCAAKGGVIAFTRSLALDYARHGIRVNCICPGLVHTPLAYVDRENFDDLLPELCAAYPLGRIGRPEDVAYAALFFASEESSWVTGQTLVVDGGYTIK